MLIFLLCTDKKFACFCNGSGGGDQLNESFSDPGAESDLSPTKEGGRMTRLRARGGVRDRPPIIDEDDEEMFQVAPPIVARAKRKPAVRKQPVERVERPEKERVEKPTSAVDRERDVTLDENSLYFIVRHSKAAITVSICAHFCTILTAVLFCV